jgi:hypothetical protein
MLRRVNVAGGIQMEQRSTLEALERRGLVQRENVPGVFLIWRWTITAAGLAAIPDRQ